MSRTYAIEIGNVTLQDVREYADDRLPNYEQTLRIAEEIRNKIKGVDAQAVTIEHVHGYVKFVVSVSNHHSLNWDCFEPRIFDVFDAVLSTSCGDQNELQIGDTGGSREAERFQEAS